MKILKSIAVAFSMYSRIPMPRFIWASDDMKYHLIFFPFVGAVIGVVEYLWFMLHQALGLDKLIFVFIAMAIPLLITGGFHLDGFMDTSDALSSFQTKERRLEILKDPHIGAFSVIRVIIYGLIMASSLLLFDKMGLITWSIMFFESRAVSGICVIKYKKAKDDGLLSTEARTADDKKVLIALIIEFIAVALIAGLFLQYYFTVALIALVLSLVYYIYIAYARFGGVTGDLAGWFVCNTELMVAIAIAIFTVLK
ncbi:MAG: adenosylcobinamide-GDP ribazoletransferase [Pseudobutyrivibrio sp.]|nr:adenosylcobinamide-GDP ribazoletransferase [Pseudobutyrivibrio sp.]